MSRTCHPGAPLSSAVSVGPLARIFLPRLRLFSPQVDGASAAEGYQHTSNWNKSRNTGLGSTRAKLFAHVTRPMRPVTPSTMAAKRSSCLSSAAGGISLRLFGRVIGTLLPCDFSAAPSLGGSGKIAKSIAFHRFCGKNEPSHPKKTRHISKMNAFCEPPEPVCQKVSKRSKRLG